MKRKVDDFTREIFSAALSGLTAKKEVIDGQIAHIKQLLGETPATRKGPGRPKAVQEPVETPTKRVMSEDARNRIATAQKKRWKAKRDQDKAEAGRKAEIATNRLKKARDAKGKKSAPAPKKTPRVVKTTETPVAVAATA